MEDLEGSSITSPYHACMITALVRVLLVMAINQLHDLGYEVFSVTTDGFITDAPADVIEELDLYGLAKYFREARLQLTGYKDPSVWSLKHVQDDLCNFTTRGNVSLRVGGADSVLGGHPGVCAHNSLVTGEEKDSYEDRHALMLAVASRTGRVETHKARPTSFRALTSRSERADFGFRDQGRYLSMDFDMKRRPLRETLAEGTLTLDGVDFKVASVDTAPWDSVEEFMKGKRLGERIAREGGCLRTRADWDVWFLRYGLEGAYVSKDPVWTLVRAAVCAPWRSVRLRPSIPASAAASMPAADGSTASSPVPPSTTGSSTRTRGRIAAKATATSSRPRTCWPRSSSACAAMTPIRGWCCGHERGRSGTRRP